MSVKTIHTGRVKFTIDGKEVDLGQINASLSINRPSYSGITVSAETSQCTVKVVGMTLAERRLARDIFLFAADIVDSGIAHTCCDAIKKAVAYYYVTYDCDLGDATKPFIRLFAKFCGRTMRDALYRTWFGTGAGVDVYDEDVRQQRVVALTFAAEWIMTEGKHINVTLLELSDG